jgi:hypothetical protein
VKEISRRHGVGLVMDVVVRVALLMNYSLAALAAGLHGGDSVGRVHLLARADQPGSIGRY